MYGSHINEIKMSEEVAFIGGASQTLVFDIYDKRGDLIDLKGFKIKWTLSYMGQKNTPILVKDNYSKGGINISSLGQFMVSLSPNDTENLDTGRYEHEPILIDEKKGTVIRPSYGLIDIRKGSLL